MKKGYAKVIVILFCVFIGSIALISGGLPDREFSELENRNLQLFPVFTMSRWKSGRYMEEMEAYISDQVVLRDQWVGLKATAEVITGKKENNDVYFGADGTLLNHITVEDESQIWKNVDFMNELASNIEVPVYFGLIPSAAEIWSEKLPKGAVTVNEAEWITRVYQKASVTTIDFAKVLEEHDKESIFYKTDHHWTSLGAYYGANRIFEAMGLEVLNLVDYDKQIVTETFYGTTYSSAGAWWVKPDAIEYYVDDSEKIVMSNFSGKEEPGQLYHFEKLSGKNKYAFFLGGNQPHCIIRSEQNLGKVLLIRDSYADSLVPFLSERFEEIHMFDLRYNRMSIKDYVKEHEIDSILLMYSFSNYIEDENQFLLIR